jgi:hypothetical protein
MPVLYRVVMDVIHVVSKISLVPDGMFPAPRLPDSRGSSVAVGDLRHAQTGIAVFRKPGLDEAPACGEIGIVFRQLPDAVQVLGQYDDGIDLERALLADVSEGFAQGVNVCLLGE